MCLLASLRSLLAVGQKHQFLVMCASPWGHIQHGGLFFNSRKTKEVPVTVFCKLILEVTPHHFCCVVLIRSESVGTSLVAQWLRICLPMQGTQVQALVREDPTCRGATKPMRHNDWACALQPTSHNCWARVPQLLKPVRLEPVLRNKRSHHNEKTVHRNEE